MANKKAYVRIQSQKTIQVTCGLQNTDVTNPDAHIPDRLKISPNWPRCSVLIQAGAHLYPSEVAEWPTVKALEKDKVLTIGEFTDEVDDDNQDVAEKKSKLQNELKANGIIEEKKEEPKAREEKQPKLADIAGEE